MWDGSHLAITIRRWRSEVGREADRRTVIVAWHLPAIVASLLLARVHPFGDAGLYAGSRVNCGRAGSIRRCRPKCARCWWRSARIATPRRRTRRFMATLRRYIVADGAGCRGSRKAMNLSVWDRYSADQQQTLMAKMVQETKAHEMPPVQYRMIHWNARIGCDAEGAGRGRMGFRWRAGARGCRGEGDPARGKALFEKRCTGCHALTRTKRVRGCRGSTGGLPARRRGLPTPRR
jgi:cytochrome c